MIRGLPVNSQDFRSVCNQMAQSLIRLPQIQSAKNPPTVVLWQVENKSEELFDGEMFLYKVRTELQKNCAGRIIFVDRDLTSLIEKERRDKQRGAITSTGQTPRLGANFFLAGRVDGIQAARGRERTTYLRFSFRLTDADSSAIVWEDDYELKKHSVAGTYDR